MAQLKDTKVTGNLEVTGTVDTGSLVADDSVHANHIELYPSGGTYGYIDFHKDSSSDNDGGRIGSYEDGIHINRSLILDGNINAGTFIGAGLLIQNNSTDAISLTPKGEVFANNFQLTGDTAKVKLENGELVGTSSNLKIEGANGKITAASFNAKSDARLKENFIPFNPEKSILDLPTYKFDFIDGAKNQIGCKAQDLQKICPEIVNEGSDGMLSIQESKIVYLLLEEVKKLRKEVGELRGN